MKVDIPGPVTLKLTVVKPVIWVHMTAGGSFGVAPPILSLVLGPVLRSGVPGPTQWAVPRPRLSGRLLCSIGYSLEL